MITDPTRALAWMVGLDGVTFPGLEDGEVTTVHVESVRAPIGCATCGGAGPSEGPGGWWSWSDLPVDGRPTRLAWHKRRMHCPEVGCSLRLDRGGRPHRLGPSTPHHPGGTMGDDPGWALCSERDRGGR
jgi:zinc-finger of transposase IS204/IS1001/IS1096/IS1165